MSLKDFQQTTALGPDALFLLEGATFDTLSGGQHQPKQIVVNALPLSKLPVAMRRMGWHTSAALMQRWFDSPGWEMPGAWKETDTQPSPVSLNQFQCDEHLVKMDWAMQFERCQTAMALAESRLTTANAIERLKTQLAKAGWRGEDSFPLGSTTLSARSMDGVSQVNFATLGDKLDVLDDMYGALGIATLKIGVVGRTTTLQDPVTDLRKLYFKVEHVGFYIRDNYDFNGSQFLGIWTENRVLTKTQTIASIILDGTRIISLEDQFLASINNDDFRAYREKTLMGGDFVIYSDILWRKHEALIDLGTKP